MTVAVPEGLKKPRGPRLGLPHLLQLRYHPITHNEFLREAYGELYTLSAFGVTLHVTAGADAAEQVLVNRDRTFASGPAWSHFIGPFFHRGLMLLDFDEHLHHRRILQHAFTNDALRRYHARDGAARARGAGLLGSELAADRPAAPPVQGAHPRPGPGDLRRRRPDAGAAGRGQPGVHRGRARRHLDPAQAGPGHAVGQGAQGAGVPRGLLPHPHPGQATRRR